MTYQRGDLVKIVDTSWNEKLQGKIGLILGMDTNSFWSSKDQKRYQQYKCLVLTTDDVDLHYDDQGHNVCLILCREAELVAR